MSTQLQTNLINHIKSLDKDQIVDFVSTLVDTNALTSFHMARALDPTIPQLSTSYQIMINEKQREIINTALIGHMDHCNAFEEIDIFTGSVFDLQQMFEKLPTEQDPHTILHGFCL